MVGAGDRGRTDTPLGNGFLRPARLPVPPHPPLGFCNGEKMIPQQVFAALNAWPCLWLVSFLRAWAYAH